MFEGPLHLVGRVRGRSTVDGLREFGFVPVCIGGNLVRYVLGESGIYLCVNGGLTASSVKNLMPARLKACLVS